MTLRRAAPPNALVCGCVSPGNELHVRDGIHYGIHSYYRVEGSPKAVLHIVTVGQLNETIVPVIRFANLNPPPHEWGGVIWTSLNGDRRLKEVNFEAVVKLPASESLRGRIAVVRIYTPVVYPRSAGGGFRDERDTAVPSCYVRFLTRAEETRAIASRVFLAGFTFVLVPLWLIIIKRYFKEKSAPQPYYRRMFK